MTKAAEKVTTTEAKAGEVANKAVSNVVNKAVNPIAGIFSAMTIAGRKSFEGVIEVDKALLGYGKDYLNRVVALCQDTVKAKCLNDVIDLQASFAHNSVETAAANTREVIEMVRTNSKEAYAPVKEVIDNYRSKDGAAA